MSLTLYLLSYWVTLSNLNLFFNSSYLFILSAKWRSLAYSLGTLVGTFRLGRGRLSSRQGWWDQHDHALGHAHGAQRGAGALSSAQCDWGSDFQTGNARFQAPHPRVLEPPTLRIGKLDHQAPALPPVAFWSPRAMSEGAGGKGSGRASAPFWEHRLQHATSHLGTVRTDLWGLSHTEHQGFALAGHAGVQVHG